MDLLARCSVQAERNAPRGPYPSEQRPTPVLSFREFAFFQRRNADRLLLDLIGRGWEAYCFSRALVAPALPLLERHAPQVIGLMLAWDRLCASYRDNRLEDQLDLFLAHDENEIARWSEFVEDQCFHPILSSPHLTRSLLWATDMLEGSLEQRAAGLSSIASFLEGIAGACGDTFNPKLRNNHN